MIKSLLALYLEYSVFFPDHVPSSYVVVVFISNPSPPFPPYPPIHLIMLI